MNMWGQTDRQTHRHTHTHTDTHTNTMTWPGLGAGPSENHVPHLQKLIVGLSECTSTFSKGEKLHMDLY